MLSLQVRGQWGRGGPGRAALRLLLEDRARERVFAAHRFEDRVERHEDRAADGGRALRPQPVDRGEDERLVRRR